MTEKIVHRPLKQLGPWSLQETLGQGSMGKVKLAVKDNIKMACKIVPKPLRESGPEYMIGPTSNLREIPLVVGKDRRHQDNERIVREIALSMVLRHPNIVQLNHVIITKHHYYLFFDLVQGTQLLDFIISHGKLSEKLARKFMRQIVSAVEYCHSNSIVHRDLKIENILIDKKGQVKLIDFGLANFYQSEQLLSTFCGSLYFAAPELLSAKKYVGPEVDIWSLGVIFYVLVCGKVPFDDASLPALHAKIKSGKVYYPGFLTTECKDLLEQMLALAPAERATIKEVKEHPWFTKDAKKPIESYYKPPTRVDPPYESEILEQLSVFGYGTISSCAKQMQQAQRSMTNNLNSHPVQLNYADAVPPIISLYCLIRDSYKHLIQHDKSLRNTLLRHARSKSDNRSTKSLDIERPVLEMPPKQTMPRPHERKKSIIAKISQMFKLNKKTDPVVEAPEPEKNFRRMSRFFSSTKSLQSRSEKHRPVVERDDRPTASQESLRLNVTMSREVLPRMEPVQETEQINRLDSTDAIHSPEKRLRASKVKSLASLSTLFHKSSGSSESLSKPKDESVNRVTNMFGTMRRGSFSNYLSADPNQKRKGSTMTFARSLSSSAFRIRTNSSSTLTPRTALEKQQSPQIDDLIEKVFLTQFFTVSNTSSKAPHEIRLQLMGVVLDLHRFNRLAYREQRGSILITSEEDNDAPSYDPNVGQGSLPLEVYKVPLCFAITIVQIQWTKLYGIRFKKISGDPVQYSKVCSHILHVARL
ncbi:kinase-like domain-containing protein [Gorgonomyces haynaldii]|nr:kinase-like domain-containing protein [Gorgonomyces haynaldii]